MENIILRSWKETGRKREEKTVPKKKKNDEAGKEYNVKENVRNYRRMSKERDY